LTSSVYHYRRKQALAVLATAVVALALAGAAGAGSVVGWQQALHARSVALDQHYHLGRFAVPASAANAATPGWLRALQVRSRAMNARSHLGAFAPPRTSSVSFHWGDAAIGAGFTAALLLLAAAALRVTVRRDPSRIRASA
jgi:hypothetical protein